MLTPEADNLAVHRVASRKMTAAAQSRGSSQWRPAKRFNASRELWQSLSATRPQLVVVQEYSPFALVGLLHARWHRLPVVTFTEVGARNQRLFNTRVRAWHGFWSLWV